ncbi:unnamed protein product (macronuclear) [Paramecium tetraurelia]|uniref:Mitochondrial cardiolipin hydrolase n=1 Tax=Paramecium tetraurelia TaxID=5888 RepID=A0DCK1_PARTE|nr:uncharacterized protein GSPATT00015646001 [Paramecium tetraurelia]CAK80768.1 unnamed protein product [Paramecium tetraurelia]|eukprot:XP_001448165.1 hypothetical protein (macronuclear) [Paramecium tetraurelia strain d4-2]
MDQIGVDQKKEKRKNEEIQHLFFPNKRNFHIYAENLKSCQKKLIVCMYQISHKILVNILIDLSLNGRDIQIVTNSSNDDKKAKSILLMMIQSSLEKIKIAVYEKELCLMHQKYCVIDDQIIMTGSANWTNNAFRKNVESVVILNNVKEAQLYTCEFWKVWNQSQILRLKGQNLDFSPFINVESMICMERRRQKSKFNKIIDLEDSHQQEEGDKDEEVKEQSDESVQGFQSQKIMKIDGNPKRKRIRKSNLQQQRHNLQHNEFHEGNLVIQIDAPDKQNLDQIDEFEIML